MKIRMPILFATLMAIAVYLGMQLPWEIGGESWGYWFFAKQLLNGEGFITPERSPLYTVFLAPFALLSYPLSTEAAMFVASCICVLSVFYFLRWRMDAFSAGLFSILWIPYFQQSEPGTQMLALACVCLAFGIRLYSEDRHQPRAVRASYALLFAALLFRPNNVIYPFAMIAHDLWALRKEGRSAMAAMGKLIKRIPSWPLLALFLFSVAVPFFQDAYPWNNVWFNPTRWFPGDPHSLGTASVIGHFNWRYIEMKYGTFIGHDFYFTNKEAFGGATSIIGMIEANPLLFLKIIAINIKEFIIIGGFNFPFFGMKIHHVAGLLTASAFLAMCYGAIRASSDRLLRTYVLSSLLIVFLTSLSYPKVRYMFPMMPVIALSACWYGEKLVAAIARHDAGRSWVGRVLAIGVLLLFSFAPLVQWSSLGVPMVKKKVSESAPGVGAISMRAAYPELRRLASGCNGIMSMEGMYLGAFVVDDPYKNYSIWEIPPFGRYKSSVYKGLTPDRVGCLFISSGLEHSIGMGTNDQIRYQNYIKPYERYLLSIGAKSYVVPHYGHVVKYSPAKD